MRYVLALVAIAACKFEPNTQSPGDGGGDDDAPDGSGIVEPELIAGGGIADGPVAGRVNIFVIDSVTDAPVAGVAVTVGALAGMTDPSGLFVALDPALAGPQTITAVLTGYRQQMWVGVNGANVTIPLDPSPLPRIPRANVRGTIAGFDAIVEEVGHITISSIDYSEDEGAPEGTNDLVTANRDNECVNGVGDCAYTVTSRVGTVTLAAPIIDIALNGPNPNDDVPSVRTWAFRTGVTVVDGMDLADQTLTMVAEDALVAATVDFGTPPAELVEVVGVLGLELGAEGTAQLDFPLTPVAASIPVPPLAMFPGAAYRHTAIGVSNNDKAATFMIQRGQTGLAFPTVTWVAPPVLVEASATRAVLTRSAGANVHVLTYVVNGAEQLGVIIFDDTTTVELPAAVGLPNGPLTVTIGALVTTWDVTSFGFDADRDKIQGITFRTP